MSNSPKNTMTLEQKNQTICSVVQSTIDAQKPIKKADEFWKEVTSDLLHFHNISASSNTEQNVLKKCREKGVEDVPNALGYVQKACRKSAREIIKQDRKDNGEGTK